MPTEFREPPFVHRLQLGLEEVQEAFSGGRAGVEGKLCATYEAGLAQVEVLDAPTHIITWICRFVWFPSFETTVL
jgi:hypothetical protein